jgi:hypothetical protein
MAWQMKLPSFAMGSRMMLTTGHVCGITVIWRPAGHLGKFWFKRQIEHQEWLTSRVLRSKSILMSEQVLHLHNHFKTRLSLGVTPT